MEGIYANERIKQTELGFKQQERDLNLSDSLRQHENTRDAQILEYPKLLEESYADMKKGGPSLVKPRRSRLAKTTGEGMMLSESLRFGRKTYNQTNEFLISYLLDYVTTWVPTTAFLWQIGKFTRSFRNRNK